LCSQPLKYVKNVDFYAEFSSFIILKDLISFVIATRMLAIKNIIECVGI
jgi:hypothetical protein